MIGWSPRVARVARVEVLRPPWEMVEREVVEGLRQYPGDEFHCTEIRAAEDYRPPGGNTDRNTHPESNPENRRCTTRRDQLPGE